MNNKKLKEKITILKKAIVNCDQKWLREEMAEIQQVYINMIKENE